MIEDEERGFILSVKDAQPLCPGIPPKKKQRSEYIIQCLKEYFELVICANVSKDYNCS